MTRLAEKAEVATETIRRMINGVGVAEPGSVAKVAAVLGEDVYDWVERAKQSNEPWAAPPEAAFLSAEEGVTLTRLIRQLTAHRRVPQNQAPRLVVLPPMEDPEDFDEAAALKEAQEAGPTEDNR